MNKRRRTADLRGQPTASDGAERSSARPIESIREVNIYIGHFDELPRIEWPKARWKSTRSTKVVPDDLRRNVKDVRSPREPFAVANSNSRCSESEGRAQPNTRQRAAAAVMKPSHWSILPGSQF
jgi:hypothetical protein